MAGTAVGNSQVGSYLKETYRKLPLEKPLLSLKPRRGGACGFFCPRENLQALALTPLQGRGGDSEVGLLYTFDTGSREDLTCSCIQRAGPATSGVMWHDASAAKSH